MSVHESVGDLAAEPITGSVASGKRQDIIDEFSNNEEKMVLISQIQA